MKQITVLFSLLNCQSIFQQKAAWIISGKDVDDLINVNHTVHHRQTWLSLCIVLLKYIFRDFKVLNELLHSVEVTGKVQRMRSRTFILGKKMGGWGTIWRTRFVSHVWPFATPMDKLSVNDIWWHIIISLKLNIWISCGVTWADQFFRYQTPQFGDVHVDFTEVCVHLGYKVVYPWNAQWML